MLQVHRVCLIVCLGAIVWPAAGGTAGAGAAELGPLLETLKSVGPKGEGNRQAAAAWAKLVEADADQLPSILSALDDANPLAANWLRTAVDAIAERQLKRGGPLPVDRLERFVRDTRHGARARRLAYEWVLRVDPAASERIVPKMLDDPSLEMRRDAVAQLIGQAEGSSQVSQAVPIYRRAFAAARDPDQVKLLAERLGKAGVDVDLVGHFGFVVEWKMIGPFDNPDEKGYGVVYPPEVEVDFDAVCRGKHGPVRWVDHRTDDDYGKVDFNRVFAEEKEVLGYAAAEFFSADEREVDLRLTSSNAVKLWLNGRLIGEHNIYHAGAHLDQYRGRAVLRRGSNLILVKVCQNAQTQSWARNWEFALRVCDSIGTAIPSADRD